MKSNKVFSSVYVDYTQIPEVITYDGIKYYRIPPVGFNAEIHKTIEFMNTTYYSLAPISGEQEVTSIQIDGITYYSVQPKQPGDNYELKSVQQDGITYYAWVAIEIDPNSPDQIIINNIVYVKQKPAEQEGREIKAVNVNAIYYASIETEMPDSIEINGVTYYRYYPGVTPDVAEGYERTIINYGNTQYYIDVEIQQVAPDTIVVDGITYYKEQQAQPGENYELRTYYSDAYGITYYAWVEVEPVIPDTIVVDGITYYREQPAQPGENYELRTVEQNGITYYAWVEVEPQVAPDTIVVDGITYYKVQPAEPEEGEWDLLEYYSQEWETMYYTWIPADQDIPSTVINPENGKTYFITIPDQPGENYTLDTYTVNGIAYYAWIKNEDEPQPSDYFLYYIGHVPADDPAPITSANYQELASSINSYPSPWVYETDDDSDVYVLVKDNINLKGLLNHMFNKDLDNVVEEFDGYKIIEFNLEGIMEIEIA